MRSRLGDLHCIARPSGALPRRSGIRRSRSRAFGGRRSGLPYHWHVALGICLTASCTMTAPREEGIEEADWEGPTLVLSQGLPLADEGDSADWGPLRAAALDEEGRIYLLHSEPGAIRVLTKRGEALAALGGSAGKLTFPVAVAIDQSGRIAIADFGEQSVVLYRYSAGLGLIQLGEFSLPMLPSDICWMGETIVVVGASPQRTSWGAVFDTTGSLIRNLAEMPISDPVLREGAQSAELSCEDHPARLALASQLTSTVASFTPYGQEYKWLSSVPGFGGVAFEGSDGKLTRIVPKDSVSHTVGLFGLGGDYLVAQVEKIDVRSLVPRPSLRSVIFSRQSGEVLTNVYDWPHILATNGTEYLSFDRHGGGGIALWRTRR